MKFSEEDYPEFFNEIDTNGFAIFNKKLALTGDYYPNVFPKFDSIPFSSLKADDIYSINKSLGQQLSYLAEIARKRNIPVLVTNQVYSDFENKNRVNMVGGDILKYGSKCLIELQSLHGNKRRAVLRKHRSLPEKKALFEIKEDGLYEFKREFDKDVI